MLVAYCRHNPGRTFLTSNTSGAITGYLVAGPGWLGPWIAQTPHDAECVLRQALSLSFDRQPSLSIPSSNTHGIALLQQYAFQPQKTNLFMRRGAPFPGQRVHIYGQASPALG